MSEEKYVEIVNGKVYEPSKLKELEEDKRDFKYGSLMGLSLLGQKYAAKKEFHVIKTLSVKDQHSNNTCTQESATVQKEVDEGMELSEQSLSCLAKEAGAISGNGFSSLREIQKVVAKGGIARKQLLDNPDFNWEQYSSPFNLSAVVREDAKKHRSSSFYLCASQDEVLAALDERHVLHIGGDWYSGYNMNYGFSAPWLISKAMGALVGGHATAMKGYCYKYKGIGPDKRVIRGEGGTDCYIIQNSYSEAWGANFIDDEGVEHKGCFFMAMDFFHRNWGSAFAQVDIAVDTAKFLNDNQYAFVKGSSAAIYMIWGAKKQPFQDWITFLAYGGKKANIIDVEDNILNAVETGEAMDIEGSEGWQLLKEALQPDNLKKLKELAQIKS